MPLILQIESGSRAGTAVPIKPGVPLRVGRTDRADVCLADDSFLSGVHFEIEFDGTVCTLRDLNSSNGTVCRGTRITQVRLASGEDFTAGQTRFKLSTEPGSNSQTKPRSASAALDPASKERLLAEMRTNLQPLYAVLDASHDHRILASLIQGKAQYAWLFEQGTAPELMSFAPYLVPLPSASPLIEILVEMGWSNQWGVYLTSSASGDELLAFLRRLLVVDQPNGQSAFLRFYDPRVLRTLLTNSMPWQWPHFFGTVRSFFMEGKAPQCAAGFTQTALGVDGYELSLTDGSRSETRLGKADAGQYEAPARTASDHLVLSEQQMLLLKAQEHNPLADTLLEESRTAFPDLFARNGDIEMAKWIHYGCTRPQRYGIAADREIRGYVSLMMQLGRNFDQDPKLPWAADILQLRLSPTEKLARLKAAATSFLAENGQESS